MKKSIIDVYREGYEAGRAANMFDQVMESITGLLRDDPDGYFASGYRDAAAGKPFNPPPKVAKDKTESRSWWNF